VLRKEDMLELEKITHNTDILVLSDEVYEHIIFDGKEHQSVCRFPGLAERSIMVYSFGKMFHITGWKTGYAVGPANLMAEFRKAHQFIVFCVNTPVQYALNDYLSHPDHYHHLPKFYQQKRDYFLQGINESRFKPLACEGTYFQLLDYSNISQEKDTDMAIRLTKEFRLASIPVSVFYQQAPDQHLLRFCFAKKEETLDRAIEIINRI
jgi:methionine aminotransferase